MKRITAALAILGTMALSASPALAKSSWSGPTKAHQAPASLRYQAYPFRSGVPIFLGTWS